MFPPPNNPFSTGSPLSGLLSQPPRTVEPPEPPRVKPTEPVTVTESAPQTSMLSGLFGQQSQQAEPERLTADEIRARAEVQTRTYGALILLLNAIIECVKISISIKKSEYGQYLELKTALEADAKQGVITFHESDPAVKEVWQKGQKFDEALAAIEDETELDEAESKILFKAIKADLDRKNRKNELGDDSVAGAVFKLLLTRQMGSAFEFITTFTRKRAQR
jgi:hypothetical protein